MCQFVNFESKENLQSLYDTYVHQSYQCFSTVHAMDTAQQQKPHGSSNVYY